MRLPPVLRLYRWRWFINDLKFKFVIRYIMKKGWFTRDEIKEPRIELANRSIIDIWKMKLK